jgi:hypothetical protein
MHCSGCCHAVSFQNIHLTVFLQLSDSNNFGDISTLATASHQSTVVTVDAGVCCDNLSQRLPLRCTKLITRHRLCSQHVLLSKSHWEQEWCPLPQTGNPQLLDASSTPSGISAMSLDATVNRENLRLKGMGTCMKAIVPRQQDRAISDASIRHCRDIQLASAADGAPGVTTMEIKLCPAIAGTKIVPALVQT